MGGATFWDNQEKAQEVVGQLKSVKAIVVPMSEMISTCEDMSALLEMAEEDEDAKAEVARELSSLEKQLDDLELKSLLDGPHDASGALIQINARDGGTDANDWAEMMLRMYSQWATKNDYQVALVDRDDNPEAGINSATVAVRGPMAYG